MRSGTSSQGQGRLSGLDPTCRALLPLMRHILTTLTRPESQAWRLAFSSAVHIWGEGRGLAIAHRAQIMLVTLVGLRPVRFDFSDPLDPIDRDRVTDDETALLAMLVALRAGQEDVALDAIEVLTGGSVEVALLKSGLDLVQLLDPMGGSHGGSDPHRPSLRLVS